MGGIGSKGRIDYRRMDNAQSTTLSHYIHQIMKKIIYFEYQIKKYHVILLVIIGFNNGL